MPTEPPRATPTDTTRSPVPNVAVSTRAGSARRPRRVSHTMSGTSHTLQATFDTASIEVVDFGARPGTIFYVPSEGESAMAVVWLTDDDSSPTSGEKQ